jgi:hypothetical protein
MNMNNTDEMNHLLNMVYSLDINDSDTELPAAAPFTAPASASAPMPYTQEYEAGTILRWYPSDDNTYVHHVTAVVLVGGLLQVADVFKGSVKRTFPTREYFPSATEWVGSLGHGRVVASKK